MRTTRPLLVTSALVLALGACGDAGAPAGATSAAPAGSAAPAAKPTAAEAPAKPAAAVTTGEVEMRDKKKVGYSIELPPGLKYIAAEFGSRYAAQEKGYDGYVVQVMEANPKWVAGGLDGITTEMTTSPEAVKNKAKLLDKGTTDTGWYFAASIEEGAKKAVILTSITKKGDVTLMCRGNVEGPLADEPEEAAKVVVETCKSLKITS